MEQKVINQNLKKLKVFGYPWHVGHQYELAKLFGEYHMLVNPFRSWGKSSRPLPENVKMVNYFDPNEHYDLCLLHVDQQLIDEDIGKGNLFRDVNEVVKNLPKVVINHMTPIYEGYTNEEVIGFMKKLIGDIPMVVNSYQAAEQWGWGKPIIHGMDGDEWFNLPKEPRIITVISQGGMEKAYKRKMLHETINLLNQRGIKLKWVGLDLKFDNFNDYRNYIGRSAIFFFPAHDSPMPRARTEAMLSGACIVTTPFHGADKFIKNGENGFLVDWNPYYCADLLNDLLRNRYKETLAIGQQGRKDAQVIFSIERWANDWENFLLEIGVKPKQS